MKLLLFAHTPPPVHGESLMIQTLVDGFGGAAGAKYGIELHHVNARLSSDSSDLCRARPGKVFSVLRYCLQALALRFRAGVTHFFYVPASPQRPPLYRDWIVLSLCRPVFRTLTLHWHAVGLGEWVDTRIRPWERFLSHRLLDRADLSIVVARLNAADVSRFSPRRVAVVPNCIADPCPNYPRQIGLRRTARAQARAALLTGNPLSPQLRHEAGGDPEAVRVLFLTHCLRTKGLFDTIDGVAEANRQLDRRNSPLRFQLTVAGDLSNTADRIEFETRLRSAGDWLRYAGFLDLAAKHAALTEADLFSFPSYYPNESFPMALIEAMAFGLPSVTTRWRGIPEHVPEGYPGLINPQRPDQVAAALIALLGHDGADFRAVYEREFTADNHLRTLAAALHGLEQPPTRDATGAT